MDALNDLTEQEQRVLELYRHPNRSDMRRLVRLSAQYALGAGILAVLAITQRQPLYAVAVYAIFLAFVLIRLRGARRLAGVVPSIIGKYDRELATLRADLAAITSLDPAALYQCCFCGREIESSTEKALPLTLPVPDGGFQVVPCTL